MGLTFGGSTSVGADLRAANLRQTKLGDARLRGADLRGADFTNADLKGMTVNPSTFRDANLADANLSGVKSLFAGQLAGAILTGATLPEDIADGFSTALDTIAEAAKNVRKLLIVLLAGCVYSWLTILTTTNARLLTNTTSSPLPVIGTAVPIAVFYWAAPVVLIGVYLYMQLSLQRLWELLADLPAVLSDGVSLDRKAYPWLLIGWGIRTHVLLLRGRRPLLARLQTLLSTTLAWWIVPATMFLFWLGYLPRHHWPGTSVHVALLVAAVMAATMLLDMARATLRGERPHLFSLRAAGRTREDYRRAAAALAATAIMVSMSYGAISADPQHPVPRAFSAMGYSVYANITGAILSTRPPDYATIESDVRDELVDGADLRGANLRYASAGAVFLQNANLVGLDFTGATLTRAILIGAKLQNARFDGANLTGATLAKADLTDATFGDLATLTDVDLADATLANTNLTGAILTNAILTGALLTEAKFIYANLRDADLTDAVLTNAALLGAVLTDATLARATLTEASVRSARRSVRRSGSPTSPTPRSQAPSSAAPTSPTPS